MISVSEALSHILDLASCMPTEQVPLIEAAGRVMAEPARATLDQPPFATSAMDGYAVAEVNVKSGQEFRVIGESAAGAGFSGTLGPGEAVRIFTGAPVPKEAQRIIIQEDVSRSGDKISISEPVDPAHYIRPAGGDFTAGEEVQPQRPLTPSDIALLAAMNVATVRVYQKPDIALIATGDELVMPGETPGPDQIVCSNPFGLKAMLDMAGANARILPIARDNAASIEAAFALAQKADLIVTLGGASVGDHDLVRKVGDASGLKLDFYKIAMRPGKPLMAGKLNNIPMVGLPGNTVSSMVCGTIFLVPLVRSMTGLPKAPQQRQTAILMEDLPPNQSREHYMRASASLTNDGWTVVAHKRQDSSLLNILAHSNALLVRPPNSPECPKGAQVKIILHN